MEVAMGNGYDLFYQCIFGYKRLKKGINGL